MKFATIAVLLIAVQFIAFAAASQAHVDDAEALNNIAKTPLEELQELSDAGLPVDSFESFESIDLNSEMNEATQPEGVSFIEGSKSETEADTEEAEASEAAEAQTETQTQNGFPVVIPVGVAVRRVEIPVVHAEQAREMEFARIQYLQAAIAAKREAIIAQKRALMNEEAQIRRETKLVNLNRAILARNEAQIDRAQKELAKLVESYSRGLRAGFRVDEAIDGVNPIVAIPRPVIEVPVSAPAPAATTPAQVAPAQAANESQAAPAAAPAQAAPAQAAPAQAAPAQAAPAQAAPALVEVSANLEETQQAMDDVMSLEEADM